MRRAAGEGRGGEGLTVPRLGTASMGMLSNAPMLVRARKSVRRDDLQRCRLPAIHDRRGRSSLSRAPLRLTRLTRLTRLKLFGIHSAHLGQD
jgi:hypothetical protein